jgi:hypothetical protein
MPTSLPIKVALLLAYIVASSVIVVLASAL